MLSAKAKTVGYRTRKGSINVVFRKVPVGSIKKVPIKATVSDKVLSEVVKKSILFGPTTKGTKKFVVSVSRSQIKRGEGIRVVAMDVARSGVKPRTTSKRGLRGRVV